MTTDKTHSLTDDLVLEAIAELQESDPPVTTSDVEEYVSNAGVDCHRNTLLKRLNSLDERGDISSQTVRARTKIWSRT